MRPVPGPRIADHLDRTDALVREFDEELRLQLPAGAELFDAHVHVGRGSDGMIADLPELLEMLDRYGISRAFAFCLDEPDREPAFRAGNDRTRAHARASAGRLVPFARLDLNDEPVAEARRSLVRGARGIKLHPRAQSFGLDDERLGPVFAVAAEHGVPILIHGGHGLPPITPALRRFVDAHPGTQLIVAHAGVADLDAFARLFAGVPGVFFDTSTWSALDLIALFARVPAEQILHGSDYPYGQQPSSLFVAVRAARSCGLDDRRLGGVLGETANRIANGEALAEPTTPVGPASIEQPLALARVHQYLSMAAPLLWTQRRDSVGVLDLAVTASADESLDHVDLDRLRSMLETARFLWRAIPDLETYAEKRAAARAAIQLIQLADVVAITTPVAAPRPADTRRDRPERQPWPVSAAVGLASLSICMNGV
ncbi:MAG TPA: amidohydrolase family protein [Gaiellaceae bacterium]